MNVCPLWLILALASACLASPAQTLVVGSAVPGIVAKDQYGTNFVLTTNVHYLLVAKEMACAKSANRKLAEQGAGFLARHNAAYLMDIHSMPAIARFFALPKLRTYPERIVLVDDPDTLSRIPVQAGAVTVLTLTPALRVNQVRYWDPDRDPIETVLE